jgi:hypothetical protein
MRTLSALAHPKCHLAHVPGPDRPGTGPATAVWICEYPYRTMRLSGPSADCSDCPVWRELEDGRRRAVEAQVEARIEAEIHELESLML